MPMDMEEIKKRIREAVREELGVTPRVKVLAFGGGAGKVAEYIHSKGIPGVKVIAVNADGRVTELNVDKKMRLGKEILGTHADTNGMSKVGEYIVSKSKAWILEEARDADAIVIIAALGGGMGTGGAVEAMRILKEKTTKPVMGIFILPFSVEADRRERAMETLRTIEEENLGTCITFDSDSLLKTPSLPLIRGYQIMYEEISGVVLRLANFASETIRRKFEELYLLDFDELVDEKRRELVESAQTLAS